jgi:hypothetical protein
MLETVQKCPACFIVIDGLFPQAACQLGRCPRTTVEAAREIKAEPMRVAKPRKVLVGHRLNIDQVREIRSLAAQGIARTALAHRFSVTRSTVGQIVRGELWRNLPERAA